MSAPGTLWTEHRTPQGRPYWFHTVERRSVWEKPSELKTPRERALEATPWKEYKSGDRSYYVHSITKESTWTLPPELKQILDRYPADGAPQPLAEHAPSPHLNSSHSPAAFARSPVAVPSPNPASPTERASGALSPGNHHYPNLASGSNTPHVSSPPHSHRASHAVQTMSGTTELNFKGDKEAAQAAFLQLLAETGVDIDWTWETTMRAIITNPLYKALKTIAERKAAFNKYLDDLRKKRAEEQKERLEQLKPVFRKMIEGEARLKSYSSFETASKWLSDRREWKLAKGDDEARRVFDEIVAERRQAEREAEETIRQRNKEMLMALLKTFEADVFTRWRDAHRTILESQEYTEDAHLGEMEVTDMLVVFEELMKDIEKEADLAKRQELDAKRRQERQNRDAFKRLLASLKDRGKIKARTTWGEILPLIKDDPDFLRCVGQFGSTPLDLFYDLVDSLDQQLEKWTADALQHASKAGHNVTPSTTEAEFLEWTSGSAVPVATLKQIYTELIAYLGEEEERKTAEERRRLERKHRHRIEELRYALKKLEPPLDLDAGFDTVQPRLVELPEYKEAVVEDERIARWAWDKFVRRQREKEAEAEGRKRKQHPETHSRPSCDSGAHANTNGSHPSPPKRIRRDDESEPEEGEV